MSTSTQISQADLKKIESSIQKVINDNQHKLGPVYLDLLKQIVDVLNDLRLTVEFDHEARLKAIEDFLADR